MTTPNHAVSDNGTAAAHMRPADESGRSAEDALSAAVEKANAETEATQTSEYKRLTALLRESFVDASEEIEKTDYLFEWQGVEFAPRQNIVSLKAPAKAGKTFVLSALTSIFLTSRFCGARGFADESETVLFVDTEQARNSTRKVFHRILKQAPGRESRLAVFNVRKAESRDRLPMLEIAVKQYRPSLIIVDGIADLIPGMDYNNQEAADAVITRLSALAEDYNAVVIAAIHTNKGDSKEASGWLGRILLQKCALEIGLSRKAGDNTRTLEFVTRDREVKPMTVAIEETEDKLGAIRIVEPQEAAEAEAQKTKQTYRTKLMDMGIEPPLAKPRPDFVKLIIEKKTLDPKHPYNRNNAEKLITRCIDSGALSVSNGFVVFNEI